jgi:hypothetical protein
VVVAAMVLAATVPALAGRRHRRLLPLLLLHTGPPPPRLMDLVLLIGEVLVMIIVLPVSKPNIPLNEYALIPICNRMRSFIRFTTSILSTYCHFQ